MNSNPYILLDEKFTSKLSNLHPFSFFTDYQLKFYRVRIFTYAATASKVIDDVTKLVMHRVFNTNL